MHAHEAQCQAREGRLARAEELLKSAQRSRDACCCKELNVYDCRRVLDLDQLNIRDLDLQSLADLNSATQLQKSTVPSIHSRRNFSDDDVQQLLRSVERLRK